MIRVVLPAPLRLLARVESEVTLVLPSVPSLRAALELLEATHPPLRGAIRDQVTGQRRRLIRFFVCGEDWSHESLDRPLPEAVVTGQEPLLIVGAIAGG